ncbi:MAG: polysaccharide biosynthesis/export family protein [Pedobacter sp.]
MPAIFPEPVAIDENAADMPANEKVEKDSIAADKAAKERISAEKAEQVRLAVEKAEKDRIAAGKTDEEKMPTEKAEQVRQVEQKAEKDLPAAAEFPENTRKTSASHSSSTWQGFLAMFGLHDERPSIPPLEVNNAPQHLGQDYIIGPGDVLGISVWRDDSLTKSVVVLPDGKIQYPLLGEIMVGGKTVAQLKKEFVEKLSSYIVDADITVEVKQSNSLFIYIIGKVNNPGRQMLVANTTVLQALAMAGGLNIFAEKDDIKIFRQDSDKTLVYSFRYSQVVSGNNLDDNLLLKRGDVIVVP